MKNTTTIRKQLEAIRLDDIAIFELGHCFFFYDWFCKDSSLKSRLKKIVPKINKFLAAAYGPAGSTLPTKIDIDTHYFFLKNNCPMNGRTYDDFRICDCETDDVVWSVIPASGHNAIFGQAQLWGKVNNFKCALVEGTWSDIEAYFTKQDESKNYAACIEKFLELN